MKTNSKLFNYTYLNEEMIHTGKHLYYQAGEKIVTKGDTVENIIFICEGKAIGIKEYLDGKEYHYFHVDSNSGNIGMLEMFARKDTILSSIIALTNIHALCISKDIVYNYILSDIDLLKQCTYLLAHGLYQSSKSEGKYYHLQGIDRIRICFIEYYEQISDPVVTVHLTYHDIADMTGISVRTVSRSLQKLRNQNEIGTNHQKIIIHEKHYHKLKTEIMNKI